jgi:hypothetical protein
MTVPSAAHGAPARPRVRRAGLATLVALVSALLLPVAADARRVATTPGFDGPTKRLRPKAAATQRLPQRLTLASAGARPHVVVDDAGTAYVTWRVDGGGPEGEDAIGFCRLPRAATGCDNPAPTRLLVPQKPYGEGDGAAANKEVSDGPFPVIVGDQLVILTTRYPTTYALPDGAGTSDKTTVLFVSLDGGTTFSEGGPAAAGMAVDAQPVAFGTPSSPRIAALSSLYEGGAFVQAIQPGAFTPGRVDLGAPDAPGEEGQLAALPDGGVAAVFTTGPGAFAVRRFDGQGDPNDAARWTTAGTFRGYDPSLAAGPGGRLFVASRPSSDVGVYAVTEVGGGARGTVQPTSAPFARLLGRDGQLSALVLNRGDTRDAPAGRKGLYLRRGSGGSLGDEQRLTSTSDGIDRPRFDAAPDGGGFAVWTPQLSQTSGTVEGLFFGELARSSGTGLPTTTPGSGGPLTAADCNRREFGKVKARVETGCFLNGQRAGRTVAIAEGPLRVNGIRFVPAKGTQLVIDPDDAELYTAGDGTARAEIPVAGSSPIVLWDGGLRQKLQTGKDGRLFNFDVKQFPVKVKGLSIVGALEPRIDGDGSKIPLALKLPTPFGDATGEATLRIDPQSGLRLDSLALHADEILIPPVTIKDLHLSWTSAGDRWTGGAKIGLPGGASISFEVVVADGKLVSLRASYFPTFPGIGLYPNVFLHRIDAGLALKPLSISGGAGVGFQPLAPPSSVGESGTYLLNLNGSLTAVFGDPFLLKAHGELDILSVLTVATADFEFSTDGYAKIAAEVGAFQETRPWLYLGARISIYAGKLGVQGKATGTGCALGRCVNGFEVLASTKGLGGCGSLPFPSVKPPFVKLATGSATYVWGDVLPEFNQGCDLQRVTIAGARQAGGGTRFAVPPGARGATVNVRGADGAPTVDLIDPSGRVIQPEADGDQIATAVPDGTPLRIVALDQPAAGTWQVVPREGSPALTKVSATVPARAPKVRATLSRARNGQRTVRYRLDAVPDETVRFVERTRRGEVVIAKEGRKGSFRFRPNPLVPGKHVVEAQVLQDGIVKHVRTVATFTQPRLRVGTPRGVAVRRRGSRLQVRFRPAGPVRHVVVVRYADGARETTIVPAGRRSVLVRAPRRTARGGRTRVAVRALSAAGRLGRPGNATLRR